MAEGQSMTSADVVAKRMMDEHADFVRRRSGWSLES